MRLYDSVVSMLLLSGSILDPYRPFWIFVEVTADYSFPDLPSPFPVSDYRFVLFCNINVNLQYTI